MTGEPDVAAAATLLADPSRAALVLTLMDEKESLPGSELAARAGIAASTASEHLARLVAGGFLETARDGRHRFYRLAGPDVATAVEALATVAPRRPVRTLRDATASDLLCEARTCYDHLAGRLGVALARGLEEQGVLAIRNGTFVLGRNAPVGLAELGVDLEAVARQRRQLVRGCLDWSEREMHVAGALGAAIAARLFELGWIERRKANRSVSVTKLGKRRLADELGVEVGVRPQRH
jgi:DNA-binding transcriptional ArsR family regulator